MKNDTEVALRLPPPALCQLDYHYCKAGDLLADTTNTSSTSGGANHRVMKRKIRDFVDSYREEEFYLERPAPKRLSPFLNTPKQRKDERKRIVRLSVHKLRAMEDPENFLRKSVLINNVLRRLHQEIREEKRGYTRFSGSLGLATAGYPYYRPRRIDYDMLDNSYLPTPAFLFDEPCFPTETEKITDDMTDSLVRSLEASTPPPSSPSSPLPVNHLTTATATTTTATTTTTAATGVNVTTNSLITPTTTTTTTTTTGNSSSSSTITNTNTTIITINTTITTSTTTPTNNTTAAAAVTTTTTSTTPRVINTTPSNSLPGNVNVNNHICNSSNSVNMCVTNNNTNTNNDNNNNNNNINFNTYNTTNTNTNTTTTTTTTNSNTNNIHHNNFSTSNFLTSGHVGFTSFATTPPTGLTDYRNTGITSAGITVQEKQISVDMDVVFNNLIRALGET